MKAEYWPDHDLLNVTFAQTPYQQAEGEEVREGIVLMFDDAGRLAEMEVAQASERIDLQEMRRQLSFEERRERAPQEAAGDGRAA